MELLHLEVNNIGPFKGSQKLSFFSSDERFVHIVIGSNGSGKTVLLNVICWALGLYDPRNDKSIKQWVYRDCEFGSVKLRVQVGAQVYDIARNSSESVDYGVDLRNEIQINLVGGLATEPIKSSEASRSDIFSSIKTKAFHQLLVFNEWELIEQPDHVLKTPVFVAWAKYRLAGLEIPGATDQRRQRIISAAIEHIGGPFVGEAAGEKVIGAMLLHSLFREWLMINQGSPGLNPLITHSVPWLLDRPFFRLDSEHQIIAAWIIANFQGAVLIFTDDIFSHSAAKLIREVMGSVSAIRVGWSLGCGTNASIFGRSLELTRDDKTEFSEILSPI
jgi:hypothetical protein